MISPHMGSKKSIYPAAAIAAARPQPFPSKLGLHRHDAIVILTPRVEKMKFFDRRFRPFGLTFLNFLYFIWKEEGKENTIDPSFLKFGQKMTEKKIFEKSLKSQNCCIRIVSSFFLSLIFANFANNGH